MTNEREVASFALKLVHLLFHAYQEWSCLGIDYEYSSSLCAD